MNKYEYVITKKKESILISKIEDVHLLSGHNDFPHWGWAVFWILLFWPGVIVWLFIGIARTKYSVELEYKDGSREVVVVNQDEINKLLAMIKEKP